MSNLSQKIRFCRRVSGISQLDLADAVGVSRTTVSLWETETAKSTKRPHHSNIEKIAAITGFPVQWFFDGKEPAMPTPEDIQEYAIDSATPREVGKDVESVGSMYFNIVSSIAELSPYGSADLVLASTLQTLVAYRSSLESSARNYLEKK